MPEDPNQADPTTEKSEEQKRLEYEKALAELRQQIAEAEKAELEAKLPSSDTKGVEGTTTLAEQAGYYAEVLAYKTLTTSAEEIADRIQKPLGNGPVILVDQHEAGQAAALWELIKLQIDRFDQRFDDLLARHRSDAPTDEALAAPAALPLLAALPSLLGAAVDVASFFRVNRTLTGRKIELSNEALLAEMARVLQARKHQVVIPGFKIGGPGELLTLLATVTRKRHDAAALRDELKTDPDAWKKIENQFALIEAFDAFAATLTAKPSGGGASPLETVATVDWIKTHPGARVLYVKVVSQGGEVETKKGPLRKGKVTFLAGTVTVFFLLDQLGVLLASGTISQKDSERFEADD